MSLSDAKVRNAKATAKPYKISDGDGLFLLVTPNGSKYWRFKYYYAGKEKLLAFGVYPDVSLSDARDRRSEARRTIAAGNDPGQLKKEAKVRAVLESENTFEKTAREWLENRKHKLAAVTYRAIERRVETHILPTLARRQIPSITPPEVLILLRKVESAGTIDTAHRVMQTCSQIFTYAIATGRAERNPVPDLRGALKQHTVKHQAYLTENELPEFLEKLAAYHGDPITKLATRFLLLTFVRTKELRGAQWQEFNLDKAEWRIPAERMKMKLLHIVPLSKQAIKIIKEIKNHSGNQQYIFPNSHNLSTFMSENTILYALYRMGYHSRATGHGFRSTASTILNENGFSPDVIERQLAHSEPNSVRAAYNHAQYLPERRKMMQWWADYLDKVAAKN